MDRLMLQSPIGRLCIEADGAGLTRLYLPGEALPEAPSPLLEEAARQLTDYFACRRTCFSLPIHPMGTPFQQGVWRQLRAIPYGKTLSYGHVARLLGRPGAARAVGGACHANPLLILIPCHRVVGSTGALTGFGAGLAVKKALLELEGWPGSPGNCPTDPEGASMCSDPG
ncbi:MAG: methylated-DNA--[protein]-cysteine S-methyltransferase [Candidatus Excrementavichristensenella sp.]|jgi:methylated-DNA-[protein]-cysteine S-methyltransferase